jgi:hypothetical protein
MAAYCSEACRHAAESARNRERRQKRMEHDKEYDSQQKAAARVRREAWKAKNPDKHRESTKQSVLKWNKEHPEKAAEYQRSWSKKNADKLRDCKRRWVKNNLEKVANWRKQQTNRRRKLPHTLTLADWKAALEYFDHKCAYCRTPLTKAHREHFVPAASGGGYTRDNIIPACASCNFKKYNKNPIDWLASQIWGLIAYARVITYLESQKERLPQ